MPEIVINLHTHTRYSDGFGTHADIAHAGIRAGLDAVIVTDHNVYVEGVERYYTEGEKRVLLLVGEEVHDQARIPQKNHLLVFGTNKEMACFADDLPRLTKAIQKEGGLSFVAHPTDPAAPAVDQEDLSWEDWQVGDLNGIELWNHFSEYKGLLKSKLHAVYYGFFPSLIARGPFSQTLRKWDELLASGRRLMAVGGSDAHALHFHIGPFQKVIFPYEFHFRSVNTHLLLEKPLTGEVSLDRRMIYEAMRKGKGFVANDMPASAKGFTFTAHGFGMKVGMGEEISAEKGVTMQIHLPRAADCRLICNGKMVQSWQKKELCTYITTDPGTYRVEAFIDHLGRTVGWIFSNPIFILY
jgi:hypothetical protein